MPVLRLTMDGDDVEDDSRGPRQVDELHAMLQERLARMADEMKEIEDMTMKRQRAEGGMRAQRRQSARSPDMTWAWRARRKSSATVT